MFYTMINKGAAAQNKAGNGDPIVPVVLSTLSDKMPSLFWDTHVRVTKQCYVFVSWCHTITNKYITNVNTIVLHCVPHSETKLRLYHYCIGGAREIRGSEQKPKYALFIGQWVNQNPLPLKHPVADFVRHRFTWEDRLYRSYCPICKQWYNRCSHVVWCCLSSVSP